jgi:hypothetical protein
MNKSNNDQEFKYKENKWKIMVYYLISKVYQVVKINKKKKMVLIKKIMLKLIGYLKKVLN